MQIRLKNHSIYSYITAEPCKLHSTQSSQGMQLFAATKTVVTTKTSPWLDDEVAL